MLRRTVRLGIGLYLLLAAVEAGHVTLAVILVLTSFVSYYYYLRVIWKMYFEEAPEDAALPAPAGEHHHHHHHGHHDDSGVDKTAADPGCTFAGFGSAVAGAGDLDGDGIPDLVVGAPGDDGSGTDRGALWVLFLNAEGRVREQQKIADGEGGFSGDLANDDRFGSAVARIGDINRDGIADLAVGAPNDDDGSGNAGAVWIVFLEADGRVDGWQKVSEQSGGFGGDLSAGDRFGAALTGIGDLDNDGIVDLAVGAPGDDDGGDDQGALWILFMQRTN